MKLLLTSFFNIDILKKFPCLFLICQVNICQGFSKPRYGFLQTCRSHHPQSPGIHLPCIVEPVVELINEIRVPEKLTLLQKEVYPSSKMRAVIHWNKSGHFSLLGALATHPSHCICVCTSNEIVYLKLSVTI